MRLRIVVFLASFLAVGFLSLLVMPGASAAQTTRHISQGSVATADSNDQSIKGTLRDPDGKPVAKVTLNVEEDGAKVGSTDSAADGTWKVAVPKGGTYSVSLDVSTLPKNLQMRTKAGENLSDVVVASGSDKTVIFPLISSDESQLEDPSASASNGPDEPAAPSKPSASTSKSFGDRFLQLFVEGIKYGAIIAITAVGLSLVFGTTGLINFAHGEMVTLGAMAAFFFNVSPFHLPLIIATIGGIIVGALVGGLFELGLWRPMRRREAGRIQMFIISIGLSLLLRHVLLILFGSRRRTYGQYTIQKTMNLGPLSITPRDLIITVLSILVLLGVAFMLQRTRIGKATRAVSDNVDLAEASGIDVNRVILVVWMIGGGLAAIGGVFYGLSEAVYWDMGFNLLLLMFAGVILGGLGSAYGAIVGSFVVGLVAQLSTLWFAPELQNAWAMLALIVVLVVRPQGILGRAERAG